MQLKTISLEDIEFRPGNPRLSFVDEAMNELVKSLKREGLIQPILVRPKGLKYELVVGERRVRAAIRANIPKLPAIIREDITDEEASRLRLIENINRRDLNVFEKVAGIKAHMEKYGFTLEQTAQLLHKRVETLNQWIYTVERTSPRIISRDIFVRKLGTKALYRLAKYTDETQEKLAEKIVKAELTDDQIEQFLNLFNSNPDVDLEILIKKAKEQMKTIEVTLPVEEAEKVLKKAEEIRRRERKARKKLEKRPRKRRKKKAKKEEVPTPVEVPIEMPSLKKLWETALAKAVERAGLTSDEIQSLKKFERLFPIDQMRIEEFSTKAEELVEMVIKETRPIVMVLEVPPKVYRAIEAFASSEGILVKDAALALIEECLERRGFYAREVMP